MPTSTQYSLAFLVALSGIFSGCCGIQRPVGCGSCGVTTASGGACPGLLHGELAGRIRDAITGGCCSGCGEVYYDEQINEPPTCDPCSGSGEFTGSSCGPCRPLFERLRELWCAPCGSGCGCDACGSDMYATGSGGSGYCQNCRDGVAGNPGQHVHHHAQHTPTQAMPQHALGAKEGTNAVPENGPSSTLEPVPDPNADAPPKSTPVQVEGRTTSQRKPTRSIQVPAAQSRQPQSRLVK